MTASVGVLVYNGYHELEFWYPVLRLREAGIAVSVLGVEGDQAVYSLLGYPVVPNSALTKASPSDFSAIVIPGGNVRSIAQDSSLRAFLAEARGHGAVMAADLAGGDAPAVGRRRKVGEQDDYLADFGRLAAMDAEASRRIEQLNRAAAN